jgi:Heavy metal binding domain
VTLTTFLRRVKVAALIGAALIGASVLAEASSSQPPAVPAAYLCPMHPDIVTRAPGACPRCGMALTPADPFDAREFLVDLTSTPGTPRAGAKTRVRLTVREPVSRAVVRDFVEVHEKPYHLFVVSQDLEHYDHVHPSQQADGSYAIDITLPKPGFYKLYSDFLPLGGLPQVVTRSLATAGFYGTLASQRARLVPDETRAREAGGMRVTLTLPPDGLVAGRDEALRYHIADATTGEPIADLEPYLAAFGHTLVLSEDTIHYVHAHPVEWLPDNSSAATGGPNLTFKAMLPKPGRYRIWTQLKRRGVVSTVSFTVAAASPAER